MAKQRENSELQRFESVLSLYTSVSEGISAIAQNVLDLHFPTKGKGEKSMLTLDMLRLMYREYAPFRHAMENKETALLIRNKYIVDMYTRDATESEKSVLQMTEAEAQLSRTWILRIMEQDKLESKTLTTDFNSPALIALHAAQAKMLAEYRQISDQEEIENETIWEKKVNLEMYIQMTILALAEGLGFGG